MDPNDTLRAIRNYRDRAIRPGLSVSERVRALEAVAAEFCDLDLFLLDKDNPLPEDWARPEAEVMQTVETPGQPVITGEQIRWWAGRPLTKDEIRRLGEAIPNSSIPEAVAAIVDGMELPPWDPSR